MAQVKTELGRDAVILHTRRFKKGGFLGFFAKDMVEVMAAIESNAVKAADVKSIVPIKPTEAETKIVAMQEELATMKNLMEQVLDKVPQGGTKAPTENPLFPYLQLLLNNDVDLPIAEELLKNVLVSSTPSKQELQMVKRQLYHKIHQYFANINGIEFLDNQCKVVALIGPTGVGKTTTIAKLAANFALKQGYKVALVTADTYRIAAVDQLKTYADIIGVPLDIVYTPEELKAAINRYRDKNLVLVDTAGRSPSNQQHLVELQTLLSVDASIEKHLVLGTNTKYRDALEIVNKFSACSPQKFLFTKADESTNIGTIFNLLYHFPARLSYITTGQNVPDDIELADPAKLANLLLKE